MTSGDTLFPIPSPDFLFVHTATLYYVSGSLTDGMGRAQETYTSASASCYLAAPDPSREETAGSERIKFDAVLLIPRTQDITALKYVKCEDSQLPPMMAGKYRVLVTRPNLSHTRVLLERFTGVWEWD